MYILRNLAVSGFKTVSSDASKNCWFVLNTTKPLIAIPSNSSDGNVDAEDISIGSDADTVSADSAKKSGSVIEPGLDVITFDPDRKANHYERIILCLYVYLQRLVMDLVHHLSIYQHM